MEEMKRRLADLSVSVLSLEKAVHGDRDNPRERPGIVQTQEKMDIRLERTNEILEELRSDVRKVFWALVTAVISSSVAGLVAVLIKR